MRAKSGIMNNNTRNEIASYGLEILKKSVLDVLYQEWQKNDCSLTDGCSLGYNAIHEALGIERIKKTRCNSFNDYLVRGILLRLQKDDYAKYIGRDAWRITQKGISMSERG